MYYYFTVIKQYFAMKCSDKYKKLYEEEKDKYEELKEFTEQLIYRINPDLIKDIFKKC